jgi:cephalosporin-C deacetylase
MAHFDLPLDQLRTYSPTAEEPDDFDDFWSAQLENTTDHDIDTTVEPAGDLIRSAHVLDVRYSGHGGARVAAWLYLPHEMTDRAPVVIEFIGYNGGRGRPIDWLRWSSVGCPHLVVDSRGQGGRWRSGDTPDPGDTGEPGSRGFVTRGLADPSDHYYSRLFVDAARAIDATRAIDALGDRPVVVSGGSQGGALSLAAASLSQQASVVLADVPFLSDFRRAVAITDTEPYSEIREYCATYPDRVGSVFRTLSYFDVANHARRVRAPSLFSVGLMDEVTPPSTVFAAFNNLTGDGRIEVYEFNGHEGGGSLHFEKQVAFVREHLG